jgi:hypothetical protein
MPHDSKPTVDGHKRIQADPLNRIIRPLERTAWAATDIEYPFAGVERAIKIKVEFPRFDGHLLTMRGECPDAENEEPVPCGIQGADGCAGTERAQR